MFFQFFRLAGCIETRSRQTKYPRHPFFKDTKNVVFKSGLIVAACLAPFILPSGVTLNLHRCQDDFFFALLLLPSGFQEASVARDFFFSKDQSIQKLSSYFVFSMQDTRRAYKLYAVEPAVKKER